MLMRGEFGLKGLVNLPNSGFAFIENFTSSFGLMIIAYSLAIRIVQHSPKIFKYLQIKFNGDDKNISLEDLGIKEDFSATKINYFNAAVFSLSYYTI